jgi:uncharacterized protein YdhG (YjbR/CyaY superfamily)
MGAEHSYSSIDDYIQAFPAEIRQKLVEIRSLIRQLVPEAEEKISYRLPTFYLNGNLVHFGAFSSHIGFYPTSSGIEKFKSELSQYKHSKGAVQFPLDEALPVDLITRIVRFRVEENHARRRK